ncbi:hypothetical protein TVAG_143400 [Trichomonas vaginalis G3]|uniref:Uncharacterized protein n=1 Tax=Trichomonas vaginalis (strain ATCC PRA-98 / G3) TaxID=412133 RepID=A2EWD6_TRIV3|nr:hypothetical protein TVAGG3_0353440 [Trichomonas vaginalis G3]EAY03040.1 hypothetical protein TVAG_143400 [Trichomonas vaginalis G3]KAI5531463.1 hypothetical protein TVAGG3_0353440 [Trichomonas vaginalis G3]|eukprot:XP_001315263.1 hypothetical protein [Trichomonas vaginalis G3]
MLSQPQPRKKTVRQCGRFSIEVNPHESDWIKLTSEDHNNERASNIADPFPDYSINTNPIHSAQIIMPQIDLLNFEPPKNNYHPPEFEPQNNQTGRSLIDFRDSIQNVKTKSPTKSPKFTITIEPRQSPEKNTFEKIQMPQVTQTSYSYSGFVPANAFDFNSLLDFASNVFPPFQQQGPIEVNDLIVI